jgi:hypothetical protein
MRAVMPMNRPGGEQVDAHAGRYWSDTRGVERRSGSAFVTSSAMISAADWWDRTAATD